MERYKKYLIIFAVILAALLVAPIVRWAVVGVYDSVSSSIHNKIRQAELRDQRAKEKKCKEQAAHKREARAAAARTALADKQSEDSKVTKDAKQRRDDLYKHIDYAAKGRRTREQGRGYYDPDFHDCMRGE